MQKYLKVLLIVIIAGTLHSCNKSIDRTDYESVSENIFNAVMNNDTLAIKNLWMYQMDSIEAYTKKEMFESFKQFKDKNVEYLKTDTSISDWSLPYINIYFKIDTSFYQIYCMFYEARMDGNKKNILSLHYLKITNLTEEYADYNNTPFCPKGDVSFKGITWGVDFTNKTFSHGKAAIQNNSDNDIDYIKFRVTLTNNGSVVFNQTVEHQSKIYKGDIINVDIPGMKEYYTGFIINKDNLTFQPELIEIRPKPEYIYANTVKELKELYK